MEQEIDLRPYLRALLRRWWAVVGAGLALALILGASALLGAPPASAGASLLIVSSSAQVTLDARFTSRDSLLFTNVINQRDALIDLATNPAIEARAAAALAASGGLPADYTPGSLAGRIAVAAEGDLLRLTASGPDEESALALAEAWATAYADAVAEFYTRDSLGLGRVEAEIEAARGRLAAAQGALEELIAAGDVTRADQEVQRLRGLVDSARIAEQLRFSDYLTRSNDLDLLIQDTELLRTKIAAGETASSADTVAALLLRVRLTGGSAASRPFIQIDSTIADEPAVALADLDRLAAALIAERERLAGELERLGAAGIAGAPAADARLADALVAAQGRLEQAQAHQRALVQARDVASSVVELLLRRADELRVSAAAPQVGLRYLGATATPAGLPLRSAVTRGLLGGIAGAVAAAGLLVAIEAVGAARRRPAAAAPLPAPGQPLGD